MVVMGDRELELDSREGAYALSRSRSSVSKQQGNWQVGGDIRVTDARRQPDDELITRV